MRLAQLWLMMSIVAMVAVSGCSPDTRYRTLSFFFDGVPAPGGGKKAVKGLRGAKGAISDEPATPGTSRYRNHGPYAARLCEACHRQGGGDLVMPVEELCLKCHDLNIKKKHIHGPVASGGCRICHNPHGSGKAFLLVSEPAEFCFYCHDKAEVSSRDAHTAVGNMSCTDCHNPHSSDIEYMLK